MFWLILLIGFMLSFAFYKMSKEGFFDLIAAIAIFTTIIIFDLGYLLGSYIG